ncbi:hypothetical protein YC2023_069462 [Brassica napus]
MSLWKALPTVDVLGGQLQVFPTERAPPSPVTWTNGWTLTNEWSSWNLPPSQFPSVMPVNVFDSLILTASKILHQERIIVHVDDLDSDSKVVVVGDIHGLEF